jgi:pseudoazurin
MKKALLLGIAMAIMAAPVSAKEHLVKMLNRGAGGTMVFEPMFIRVAPGDTVKFQSTDKTHVAETLPGWLPAGAKPFKGKLNQDVTVKFDKPGVYGVKCLPHYAMGMVALVQVGNASPNLAAARAAVGKLPPLARKRMQTALASAK